MLRRQHKPAHQWIVLAVLALLGIVGVVGSNALTDTRAFAARPAEQSTLPKLSAPSKPSAIDAYAHFQPAGPLTVLVGSQFTLDLMINSGSNQVTVAQNYLTFTNSLIQNVRADMSGCVLTSTVTGDFSTFDSELQNEVCNSSSPCDFGRIIAPPASIAFASGVGPPGPAASGDFRVAQIAFCANALGDAIIHWQFSPPAPIIRDTEIRDDSNMVVSDPSLYVDYIVHIVGPTDTPTITPTPTDTPTFTDTPTPTDTPTTTDTPTATETSTDTPTSTETPTDTPTSTDTPTETPTFTDTPTSTETSTDTPTSTPSDTPTVTDTPTNTSTPVPILIGHVSWQGCPGQTLPITLTLKSATLEVNYPTTNTDAQGFFTTTLNGVPDGSYLWRVKGPKYLSNVGPLYLTGTLEMQLDMGVMRVGDADDNNIVNSVDFTIVRLSFGRGIGQPGYDDRGNFNCDTIVTISDFNLLRANFGQGGGPPIR